MENGVMEQRQPNGQVLLYQKLFEKVLTASDVGKLCRLVIPKRYAVMYFSPEDEEGATMEAINLVFVDKDLKPWNFRYCYWKSCHSYVFTKEWYKFIKEKDLKVDDTVIFYMCRYREEFGEGQPFYMVDTRFKQGQRDHVEDMLNEEGTRDEENRRGIKLFGVNIN